MTEPVDLTLEELRLALAPHLPSAAAFDGWGEPALAEAADVLGVPLATARLAIPGGATDLIDAWFEGIDVAMLAAVPPERLAALRTGPRVRALLLARLDLIGPHREALRRALAVLAMPQNLAKAASLGWRAADRIWRTAGDTATDLNHYTKRATLAAVYASTLLAFLDDESEDNADTRAFLDRRLANVMRIEEWKKRFRRDPERQFSVVRFLGRLRYPVK